MSSSSRVCSIHTCKQSVRALCICCQRYLCIDHLKEHSDLLNAQLTPLADEINKLFEQFNDVSQVEPVFLEELEQWRQQAHRSVDRFCDKKKREFVEFVESERNQQKTELDCLRDEIDELIREENATQEHIDLIHDSIRYLQEQINELELSQFTLTRLVIDNRFVAFHRTKSTSKHLFPLPRPWRTSKLKINWDSVAANDKHLLVAHDFKLCLLDQKLTVHREIPWTHGDIYDMFWSVAFGQFLVITRKEIFTLEIKTMAVGRFLLDFHSDNIDWYCGTCSKDALFLSARGWGTSIYKYSLLPSIRFLKEYRSPISCTNDEAIYHLLSNDIQLAVLIINRQNEMRLNLCSPVTLEQHWSIQFDSMPIYHRPRCCSLNNDQWMVINRDHSELLRISADGKLVKRDNYHPLPLHAIRLGNDFLAILTWKGVNLHQVL